MHSRLTFLPRSELNRKCTEKERACRLKVAEGGGFVLTRSLESTVEKSLRPFIWPPVPQTDTGGWVEYTKA